METSFQYSVHNSPQQEKPLIIKPDQKIIMAHPTSANSLITKNGTPKITSVQNMPKMLSFKLIKPQTLACTSVVTPTIDSTQYLTTTVPSNSLLNKSGLSRIQSQTDSTQYLTTTVPSNSLLNKSGPSTIQSQAVICESPPVTVPISSSTQHTPTIVSSLDSSIIDSDDEKENASALNKDGHFIWDHKTIMLFFAEYEQHEKKLQKRKYQSKEAMFQGLAESFQKRGYEKATKNHIKNKFKLLKKKWDNHIKRTMGKNSSGKGTKNLPYKDEMIRLFGKSHSGVPPFVAGRNEIVSQEEILQRVNQNLSENENGEQSSITLHSPLSPLSAINSESQSIVDSSGSSMTGSNCSSLINAKAKVRDGKMALTLQSVKESICSVLQRESDAKQERGIKFLTELQKFNEMQKERNSILQKQLSILERMESKTYSIQKTLSDEEEQD